MPRGCLALIATLVALTATAGCNLAQGLSTGPRRVDFAPALLERLTLPPGFMVGVYAQGLGNVRNMAFAPGGLMYVTRRKEGEVLLLRDADGDGSAEAPRVVASDLGQVNGVAVKDGRLYVAPPTRVLSAAIESDGSLGPLEPFITGLPEGQQHPNRTIDFGPDGRFYLSIGASCNDCEEADPRYATIMRAKPDGGDLTIYARGLRNTIGFDWHPVTGDLWGMDHGSDWRGPDQPPEELNRLVKNGNYGWPYCYGAQKVDPQTSHGAQGKAREEYCAETVAPALQYQAHSAPLDLVFYRAEQFPAAYRHDAFVSMHGSWNRNPPTGYKVVRVRYEAGWPVKFEDFLTGFMSEDGATQFGRPTGLAVGPEGALYVADDANGVIYRITYAGL